MADNQTNRLSELLRNYSGEGPATSNLNMLAQGLRSRNKEPMNKLKPFSLQDFLDMSALATSPVPVVGDAVGLGADAYRYATDPSSRTPLNFGLTALGALPFVPPAAAIFAGPLAKTAKLDKKTLAEGMEKAGRSRDDIWKETGWFKGPEGKWKFEIDDSGALFNQSRVNGITKENDLTVGNPSFDYGPTVGGLLEHNQLKSAYPDGLTKSTIVGNKNSMFGDGVQGSYANGKLTINAPAKAVDARSTTLHELQHAIQQREGFPRGGSPDQMANEWSMAKDKMNFDTTVAALVREAEASTNGYVDEAAKLLNEVGIEVSRAHIDRAMSIGTKQALKAAEESTNALKKYGDLGIRGSGDPGNKLYHRLAGEAEARAVQSRMNMNQQQRQATPPWQSYDVPWEQLIVK